MPREKPLSVGDVVKGQHRYRIKRLVGGGGMAWVYQVERLSDSGDPSLWALKELRPQTEDPDTQAHALTLFNQEARILSQLSHQNLPQVLEYFQYQGRSYLVMEFIWGESLEKRLEKARSPLMEREVLQWAVQICEVLDYLHTRRPPVIFRDLKPSNVMVSNTGVVKLVDFGIARTYKEEKLQDTIALGSENYAAPEQWGQTQTDARSDIYGLGATMYHLLANMPPSPAFLPSEPQPLDTLNVALSSESVRIVKKAMARDREDRYQTVEEMRQALLAVLPGYVSPIQPKDSASASTMPPVAPQQVVSAAVPAQRHREESSSGSERTPRVTPATVVRPRPAAVTQTRVQPAVRRIVRRVKVCPKCTHRSELSARFCVRCGHAFAGIRPAVLRVVEPVRAAWEMPVRRSPLLLGRASPQESHQPDFDMAFYDPDGYVSRRHAQIVKAKNGYFVTDLGSSNGTYVNEQPIPPHRPWLLRNGDRIAIGEVVIQFLLR